MVRWRRGDVGAAALVLSGLALYVTGVYVAVVVGGSALAGHPDRPSVLLPVVATVVVALGFEPVRGRLRAVAARLAGARPAPYEVLTGLHADVAAIDEAPVRMARLLAEAMGARRARVMLVVQGALTPVAAWPPGGEPGRERRTVPVWHAADVLGQLVIDIEQPLTPVEERLLHGLASQAGLVFRALVLRAELAERLRDTSRRAEELRASRERVVAAQDQERRRLERDIHDGAQQHLVALAVQLRLARTLVARQSARAQDVVEGVRTATGDAIATLADLSHGIHPRQLTESGVTAALAATLGDRRTAVELEELEEVGRLSPTAEHALYFCALEAVQNASKHANGSRVQLRIRRLIGTVEVVVSDDGKGFAVGPEAAGRGLTNMVDRAEAAGGELHIASRPGDGTVVTVRVPVRSSA